VDAARKRAEVRQFYDPSTTDAWRQALLDRYNVAYVWYGPHERALSSGDTDLADALARAPYLRVAYDREGYLVYEVLRENP